MSESTDFEIKIRRVTARANGLPISIYKSGFAIDPIAHDRRVQGEPLRYFPYSWVSLPTMVLVAGG